MTGTTIIILKNCYGEVGTVIKKEMNENVPVIFIQQTTGSLLRISLQQPFK